ncbi:MAG: hypothetical protein M1305_00600 [Candidatus Marsarchaeota archaeon]|nr:hypothetical protein [Candidatus Marsarchaeota archaeon]
MAPAWQRTLVIAGSALICGCCCGSEALVAQTMRIVGSWVGIRFTHFGRYCWRIRNPELVGSISTLFTAELQRCGRQMLRSGELANSIFGTVSFRDYVASPLLPDVVPVAHKGRRYRIASLLYLPRRLSQVLPWYASCTE